MSFYRERYGCPVGLSDHSGTIYAGLAAVAQGADILEAHVCFSKELFGPDVCASLTTAELKTMVEGVRFIERMGQGGDSKKERTAKLEDLRGMFGKGIITRMDIKKGERFTMDNIAFVKPAKGVGAGAWKTVINSTASIDIPGKAFLTEDMLMEGK